MKYESALSKEYVADLSFRRMSTGLMSCSVISTSNVQEPLVKSECFLVITWTLQVAVA